MRATLKRRYALAFDWCRFATQPTSPGTVNIPMTIGAITFGITIVAAVAAFTTRET